MIAYTQGVERTFMLADAVAKRALDDPECTGCTLGVVSCIEEMQCLTDCELELVSDC